MFLHRRNQYKKKTDEELVLLFQQERTTLCIGLLYERYGHLVMGVAMKYLKNEVEAQDVTMQTFEELPDKLRKHSIQHFKSWLYIVAKNNCFMLLRQQGKKTSVEYSEHFDQAELLQDNEQKEQQLQLLENAIEKLKQEQKECVKMFFFEDKSYQQISEVTGMNLKKVKSAIQNGKRNIKLQLEAHHEFKQDI
jgi:RNA polymerase sigma factor (sigma-70 family)